MRTGVILPMRITQSVNASFNLCYNVAVKRNYLYGMSILKAYIRKADIILFFVLVGAGLFISAFLFFRAGSSADESAKVVIKSNGSVYASCALSEERTFIVPSPKQNNMDAAAPNAEDNAEKQYDYYNVVIVSGRKVTVSEASCKNQVCVRHNAISKPGESIACLPNRLTVNIEIENEDEGGGYDSITS